MENLSHYIFIKCGIILYYKNKIISKFAMKQIEL